MPAVTATVQYIHEGGDQAAYHASEAGGAAATHDGRFDSREVQIKDARRAEAVFDLDHEGFQLVPQASAVTDFYDDEQLASIYNAEVTALIKQITGARRVDVFDHTRRAATDQLRRTVKSREPSSVIHNDYTEWSAEQRLRTLLPDEADRLLAGRFAIINLWRSIAGVVETMPLAFCDSTTVKADDLVSVKRVAKDRVGELQMARFNAAHQWYYFPSMRNDEAVLIKTYDSARDGRNRFTIHTAFADPNSAVDAAPRQSLETRWFVFY